VVRVLVAPVDLALCVLQAFFQCRELSLCACARPGGFICFGIWWLLSLQVLLSPCHLFCRVYGSTPCPDQAAMSRATLVYRQYQTSVQAAPYSKTGGLGDVCGSLPKALAARGHRVMVVVPRYQDYEGVEFTGVRPSTLLPVMPTARAL
jgi:hypothetical protein